MKYPKVLVFTPTYSGKEYCRKEFIEGVSKINYPNWDFLLVDNSKSPNYARKLRREGVKVTRTPRGKNSREALAASQNYAKKFFMKNDYDYMLFLESDLFPTPDIIWRLLKHLKPVVGALYEIGGLKGAPRWPCVFLTALNKDTGSYGTRLLSAEEYASMAEIGGLYPVHGMGVGCTLVHKDIIDKYHFWTDSLYPNKHSDVYFYMELWNDGVQVFVDFDTKIHHQNSSWDEVKDR